jgi:heme exporter protein B
VGAVKAFASVVRRDLRLAARRRGAIFNPLIFFALAVTLFPLALGPEIKLLERIGGGILWVAALLAAMLSLENIFHGDHEDGFTEQMLLAPVPLPWLVLAKSTAHWLVSGLPAFLFAPVLGVLLHLSGPTLLTLMVTLALGTPVLSLIGSVGAAFTVGRRRGGALLSLLVLPLYVPVLVFGAGAVDRAAGALPVTADLLFLGAALVLALTLAPFAASAALRIASE